MTPDDHRARAEQFLTDGPRALAWMTTSPVVRWSWFAWWVLSGAWFMYGSGLTWGHVPLTWEAMRLPLLIDLLLIYGAAYSWMHAWMLGCRKVCLLPCNSWHPNAESSTRSKHA